MTSAIKVDAQAGWAIDVTPSDGSPTRRVPAGTEETFYIHSGHALSISEVRPEDHVKMLDFGRALAALKRGKRVARAGWNGKGMWLALSCGEATEGKLLGREIAAESFWSKRNFEYAMQNGGSARVLPCITMKTADGSILMGWLASQSDMLSEDWLVLEDAAPAS